MRQHEDTTNKIKDAGLELVYKYVTNKCDIFKLKDDLQNMTVKQRFDSVMQIASLFIAKPKQEVDMNVLNVGKVMITGEDEEEE